jgi:hypothetical protein
LCLREQLVESTLEKITQAMIRLQRSFGFVQTENARNKYFYFRRLALAAAAASP